ncbi:hypothetical protein pdam_00022504, partial [Pocillopora damicornis]
SREARNIILSLLTGSPLLDGGTLDSCFDDDMNNDVNSLYVEIIDKNRTRMHDLWPKVFEERKTRNPLELCSRRREGQQVNFRAVIIEL